MTSTLHCENENIQPDPEHTFRYRARAADLYFVDTGRDANGSGKVGSCARDMVGGCRRCARVCCRVSLWICQFRIFFQTNGDRIVPSNHRHLSF